MEQELFPVDSPSNWCHELRRWTSAVLQTAHNAPDPEGLIQLAYELDQTRQTILNISATDRMLVVSMLRNLQTTPTK